MKGEKREGKRTEFWRKKKFSSSSTKTTTSFFHSFFDLDPLPSSGKEARRQLSIQISANSLYACAFRNSDRSAATKIAPPSKT